MKQNKYLSIIIPFYNEEKRIKSLSKICDFLRKQQFTSELIFVNDGSVDNSKKEIKKYLKNLKFKNYKFISYKQNKGKGYAIREGMLSATGDYRLFTDIDLSTPIEEFNKFKPFLNKYDLVIGSRKRRGAILIRRQSEFREKLGKGFTLISQIALGLNLTDFTCGFKCFSADAAQAIFSRQKIKRWGFDSEILFLAKKLHFSIKEVPVIWENDSETKVKLPQDIITSLSDLFKIRLHDFKKDYI